MNKKNDIYGKKVVSVLLAVCVMGAMVACGGSSGSGDPPVAEAASAPMSDDTTPLGQKIQTNGYSYDAGTLDSAFSETMSCLGYSDIPSDLYIVLKEPYSAFPCVPLPNGCGGLFDTDNGEPVVTVTADLVRLRHEYIHYMLYYSTGDPDSNHETELYESCA